MAIAAQPAVPSPPAETDLICPTMNSVDCYPRIFQPTEDFQVVREGQDLPPGLHVRMNVWTGQKEARLNIPVDGDDQLDGLPTEQSVVVVDQPGDSSVDDEPPMRDRVPQKPPAYEAVGKIVPPREPDGNGGDSENFWNAVRVLDRTHPISDDIEVALADLSDLAHDIYYGVELAKRGDVLQNLVSLMSSESVNYRRQAASILGGSIQNNPTALKEARNAWKSLTHSECGTNSKEMSDCESQNLITKLRQSLQHETDPAVTKAKISALTGLTKDPAMRDAFLEDTGMELLLSIFVKEGSRWDGTRVKIAQYIMDSFLDEDMGAQLRIWPRHDILDSKHCAEPQHASEEGCWEHHLENMEKGQGEGVEDWLSEFLRLLRKSRGAVRSHERDTVHEEL
jgi:nucleotide exchange factor SIL1